jgi:hypothetical protein
MALLNVSDVKYLGSASTMLELLESATVEDAIRPNANISIIANFFIIILSKLEV